MGKWGRRRVGVAAMGSGGGRERVEVDGPKGDGDWEGMK
jgi:hypothetical protein